MPPLDHLGDLYRAVERLDGLARTRFTGADALLIALKSGKPTVTVVTAGISED